MASLNFFPVQKLFFIFEIAKNGIWSKKSFLGLDFFKFSGPLLWEIFHSSGGPQLTKAQNSQVNTSFSFLDLNLNSDGSSPPRVKSLISESVWNLWIWLYRYRGACLWLAYNTVQQWGHLNTMSRKEFLGWFYFPCNFGIRLHIVGNFHGEQSFRPDPLCYVLYQYVCSNWPHWYMLRDTSKI